MANWRALLPIMVSLVIAVSGSVFVYKWINKKTTASQTTVAVETQAVPVVVAVADLPWGTKITPEMVKMTPYLEESLPKGYFKNTAQAMGRVTLSPMKQGDAIVEHRLAPIDVKTGGVAAVLKPNKRAVAVKGDKVIGLSGFINPGNYVDVLATMEIPEERFSRTKIVLENILVLATGTQIEKNEKGEPAPVDVYTLEVTPEEAEKLALSAAEGKLQFALRNPMDNESVETAGTTVAQTLGSVAMDNSTICAVTPKPVVASHTVKKSTSTKKKIVNKWKPRQSVTVEIIRGTDTTRETIKL